MQDFSSRTLAKKDFFRKITSLARLRSPRSGQSGLRLTYTLNDKWTAQLHLLNGYGLTFGRANTSTKDVGLQVDYRASQE
jgi:hypothetical protein